MKGDYNIMKELLSLAIYFFYYILYFWLIVWLMYIIKAKNFDSLFLWFPSVIIVAAKHLHEKSRLKDFSEISFSFYGFIKTIDSLSKKNDIDTIKFHVNKMKKTQLYKDERQCDPTVTYINDYFDNEE